MNINEDLLLDEAKEEAKNNPENKYAKALVYYIPALQKACQAKAMSDIEIEELVNGEYEEDDHPSSYCEGETYKHRLLKKLTGLERDFNTTEMFAKFRKGEI